jgi:hypothetical protein
MTASAFGFIAICIVVIGAWDIFTEARTQTPAPQEQMSPAELSAAIEAQREASAVMAHPNPMSFIRSQSLALPF